MDQFIPVVIILAALGCGAMGGFFGSFSNVVIAALGRLSPQQGILAMQSINVTVLNPIFFSAFFGTALLSVILAVAALVRLDQPGAYLLLAAGLLYLAGVVLITMIFNVPLNEALAKVDPPSSTGNEIWALYLDRWAFWNHARTISSIASCACFLLVLGLPV
jgi:uncharacterized membrane protein